MSEADLETARQEFETRLAAADRKVYALSKERDALRRGNEKLGAVQDLLKEKDDMITQARPRALSSAPARSCCCWTSHHAAIAGLQRHWCDAVGLRARCSSCTSR